ncbi:MAG: hypothetical protein JNJ73_10565 [Hyphomonadaceae bacterium]|nr:hypothetical protein [Hyphomonadaceae bacterium]
MYTFTNERYFAKLVLPDRSKVRVAFGPGDVAFDDDTGVVNSIHIRFRDGSAQDLMLLPAGRSQQQVIDLVADVLAKLGAELLYSQVRVGNVVFDKITEAIIDHMINEDLGRLKRHFHQMAGAYYDIRTGELVATNPLQVYDFDFD